MGCGQKQAVPALELDWWRGFCKVCACVRANDIGHKADLKSLLLFIITATVAMWQSALASASGAAILCIGGIIVVGSLSTHKGLRG